jgi:protease-4
MTPETREVMDSLLDSLYAHIVNVTAQGRKKSPDEMRAIYDQGPFLPEKAKQLGLVDELRHEDEMYGELKDRLKQKEITKLSHGDYTRVPASAAGIDARRNIAFVVGEGEIHMGADADVPAQDDIRSGAFVRLLRQVANDNTISGVILRVDSPGGDALASDDILREVKLLRDKKPLVISMADSAASGGYYIAMTGDPIIAYPNTFTGSIGIIFGKVNLRGLYDKLGINKEILTRGQNAAIDTDYGPLTEAGKAKLGESLQEFYRGFVEKAAASRKMKYEQLEQLAQGRVWLGSQAKANGLIDDLGGIDKAVEAIKLKAKIPASENVRLVPYPPRRNIFEEYLRSTNETVVEAKIRKALGPLDYELWSRGGFMYLMPYRIQVH